MNHFKPFLFLFIITACPSCIFSQSFEIFDLHSLPVDASAWGDYDKDGDMDVVIAGNGTFGIPESKEDSPYIKLFRNDNGTFEETNVKFPLLVQAIFEWFDYDNDNDLDLFLAGAPLIVRQDGSLTIDFGQSQSFLFRNNGEEIFENSGITMEGVTTFEDLNDFDKSEVVDIDNDGDYDLIYHGYKTAPNPIYQIPDNYVYYYLNESDNFKRVDTLPFYRREFKFDFGDFDKDMDHDLLISGPTIYLNQGGKLVEWNVLDNERDLGPDESGVLDCISRDETSWVDVFSTGRLHIAHNYAFISDITSTSSKVDFILKPNGFHYWGDFTNDGLTDLLISGEDCSMLGLYESHGPSFGGQIWNIGGPAIGVHANDDNVLDIFFNQPGKVAVNNLQFDNNPPNSPSNLRTNIVADTAYFFWNKTSDADGRPQYDSALTYNMYVGSREGTTDVFSPMADLETGWRFISDRGNADFNSGWYLKGLKEGYYSWSVQAIDQSYIGSSFANPGYFKIGNPLIIDTIEAPTTFERSLPLLESSVLLNYPSITDNVVVHFNGIVTPGWQEEHITINEGRSNFSIEGGKIDEVGIRYFYEITMKTGEVFITDTIFTFTRYPGDGIITNDLPIGNQSADYKLISFPLLIDSTNINNVLIDDLGPYDDKKWRMFAYNQENRTLTEYTNGLDVIEAGKAYWLLIRDLNVVDQNRITTGSGTSLPVIPEDPFKIPLRAGWNLIGNPYPFNISWGEILDENDLSQNDIQRVSFNSGYDAGDEVFEVFSGVYVRVNEDMNLKIPVFKDPFINRMIKDTSNTRINNSIDKTSWEVGLKLHQNGMNYNLGGFGMRRDANENLDKYDWGIPPRFLDYLEIQFDEKTTRSIVPTQKSYIWDFSVNSNLLEFPAEIKWDNSYFSTSDKNLILFDLENQIRINMKSSISYKLNGIKEKHSFRIFYGDNQFIQENLIATKIHLGEIYPNPTNSKINFEFTLPKTITELKVSLTLFDVQGKPISIMADQTFGSGFHKMEVDLNFPPGIYYLSLIVDGQFSSQKTKKILIK